jgi:hypothetical protein
MPTYTCINFYISRSNVTSTLVRDFYEAMQIENVKVIPRDKEVNLEELIAFNQNRLESSIQKNRSTRHYATRFRQIKLLGTPYDECRMYIYEDGSADDIGFRMIVPDTDVLKYGYDLLRKIARSVVEKIPVENICTFDEVSHKMATVELNDEKDMGVQYFGFTRDEAVLRNKYFKYTLLNGGYFIEYCSN